MLIIVGYYLKQPAIIISQDLLKIDQFLGFVMALKTVL